MVFPLSYSLSSVARIIMSLFNLNRLARGCYNQTEILPDRDSALQHRNLSTRLKRYGFGRGKLVDPCLPKGLVEIGFTDRMPM